MRLSCRLLAATVALLCATTGGAAWAMSVMPLDLAALVAEAGSIFVGRVERVDTGRDAGGLPAVWTTFTVTQTLKGGAGDHVTVKQLGATFGGPDTPIAPHPGLPSYTPGESVVLFVHPASTLGFTSPVGLGQGCFRIRERDGETVVENDVGNRTLTGDVASARTRAGSAVAAPLPLEAFLGHVRTLVAATP
ncbi:MAG: hypothetical protein ABIR79_13890 [Candidatus Binatia bacterium]